MHKLWQDPQLRILLVMNIIALGAILTILFIVISAWIVARTNERKAKEKDSHKLKRFIERLKDKGVPAEISSALEELHEEIVILEESSVEQTNTFFALVQGLEERIKLFQNATNITEKKMVAVLQSIVARLKKSNREMVDKHAQNLFKKLNRLEQEEIKGLDERLVVVETFVETMQILNGSPKVEGEDGGKG